MNGHRDDRILWTTRLLGAVIVPFLVVAFIGPYLFPGATARWIAWWRNRATDPGTLDPGGDFLLPRPARAALLAAAAAQIAVAAVLLVSPSTMIAIWPWRLTPLTAQVLGAWFALPGVVALMMGI